MPETDNGSPSPTEERTALIEAAREAGRAILPLFGGRNLDVWKKSDSSPVTTADLRSNEVLREALLSGPRRDYGWLSEESADDRSRLERDRTLIVDPIDGTRAFLRGDDQFTVCLAVVESGRPLASVIYAPARDELYAAAAGHGATLNEKPVRTSSKASLDACRMLGSEKMFGHPAWPAPWPPMKVTYKNSTSYRMALVASGAFDGTIALTAKADWDTAPGALIGTEAGAKISDHLGRPLVFGAAVPRQPGLVCTAPSLYPHVIRRLAHLPGDLGKIQR